MTAGKAPAHHVLGIDVVRFMAAAFVMLFHFFTWSWTAPASTGGRILHGAVAYPEMVSWSWFGWVGVEIFFVVSGVVIAFSAERATPLGFARSRLLRLAPAAWLCATLTLVVAVAIQFDYRSVLLASYARSIVFSPVGPYIDGVYWTLAIEVSFYALVFLVLRFGSFALIERLGCQLGAVSLVFLALFSLDPHAFDGPEGRFADLLLLRHGVFFALGLTLWALRRYGVTPARLAWALAFFVGALLEISITAQAFAPHYPVWPLAPFLAFVLAVAAIAGSIYAGDAFSASPVAPLLRTIGLATYPLYLMHQLIGTALQKVLVDAGVGAWWAAIVAMLTMVASAILVAAYAEPPLRRLLRRGLDALDYASSRSPRSRSVSR